MPGVRDKDNPGRMAKSAGEHEAVLSVPSVKSVVKPSGTGNGTTDDTDTTDSGRGQGTGNPNQGAAADRVRQLGTGVGQRQNERVPGLLSAVWPNGCHGYGRSQTAGYRRPVPWQAVDRPGRAIRPIPGEALSRARVTLADAYAGTAGCVRVQRVEKRLTVNCR